MSFFHSLLYSSPLEALGDLSSATIQSGTPSVLDLVFRSPVNITTASWSIISSNGVSISSVLSGSGTSTPKFQLSRNIYAGETLHLFYSGGGATEFVTDMADVEATYVEITNNSASVARSPEQMVTAGLFASSDYIYWDAERGVTVDGSNGVTAVDDQGGGNKDLSGVASFLPTLITDSNGKKWFRFNESAFAAATLADWSSSANDYNLFIVMKFNGVVGAAEIGNIFRNESGSRIIIQAPTGAGSSPLRHAATLPATLAAGTGPVPGRVHVLHYDWTDPAGKVYVNGVLDGSALYTKMTYVPTNLRIGSGPVNGTDSFLGDITKIFFIKGTLTDAIKAELRNYFDNIYNSNLYNRFAFLPSPYTDVNVTETVIQDETGKNFDYPAFGSFCIRRSNGKYYRTMMLGPTHNTSTAQIGVLQTSTDKGTTWSEFIPLWNGYGVVTNPYGYFTSTTSVTIGTGAKTFTVAAGLTIADSSRLMICKSDDLGQSLHGTVTSYNEATGELVMNINITGGTTNTYSDWRIWKIDIDSATPDLNTPGGIFVASDDRVWIGYNKARTSPSWDNRLIYSDDDCVTLTKIAGDGTAGLLTNDYPDPGQCTGVDRVLEYDGSLYKAFYARTGGSGDREIVLYKSDDGLDGQTWTKLATIQAAISHDYEEPMLLHLGEGMFLCIMRSDSQNMSRTLFSWDAGVTWSSVRQDAYPSIGFNGAVVTPSGGVVAFGRYASTHANAYDSMLIYNNRRGQFGSGAGTWAHKKANADNYYYVYGALDWDYDLNIPVGVYWEEKQTTQGSGPNRIVFVKLQEV